MPNLLESIRLEHLPGEVSFEKSEYYEYVNICSRFNFCLFYSKFIINVAQPVFYQYESNELISAEYRRRMLKLRISPRRWYEEVMGDSVFHAEIVDNKSIEIYKCYPNSEQFTSIAFSTLRIDQGWAFHDGKFYQIGGYHSTDGGRTSDEVILKLLRVLIHSLSSNFDFIRSHEGRVYRHGHQGMYKTAEYVECAFGIQANRLR